MAHLDDTKYCPLKENPQISSSCDRRKCQWWTSAYTTENIEIEDCAIVLMAKKNADGKIPV